MHTLAAIARRLRDDVDRLSFGPPVTHVYDPLDYAWAPHRLYLERYGMGQKDVLLIGMNPGPFGMAQTGVPFGEVASVRDWLGIDAPVGKPTHEHVRRPVLGFACNRSEVSGRRLWGWARERFGTPQQFFRRFFVYNYCPLLFLERSGRNRTPDRLRRDESQPLFTACDAALAATVDSTRPRWVVGIGRFAETRARYGLAERADLCIGGMLHPSPASPRANAGWAGEAERVLRNLGIQL
jgi:single-strand selective monofunctional uracil DNA glycosylase